MSEPDLLSAPARDAVEAADLIGIAPTSCWEVAMLARKGRIELDRSPFVWIQEALFADRVLLLDLTAHIAVLAAELEWEHHDPADRMIVATAIVHEAPVVTRDRRMHSYQGVATIW